MLKIAFCDDDLEILKELGILLDKYKTERDEDLTYTVFQSPLELLAAIEKGFSFDILFLDILMPGENGIETAKEIRQYDNNMKIIFLTSSPEFAVQSYTVGAYFYQLKPVWEESFFRLMDSVLAECTKTQENSLILRSKEGITKIDLEKLEYCEVIGRTLFFHLGNGKVFESVGSLDDLFLQLKPYGNFLLRNCRHIDLRFLIQGEPQCITFLCNICKVKMMCHGFYPCNIKQIFDRLWRISKPVDQLF